MLFPWLPFLGGLGIMTIHTFFYLTLTLMLGNLFQTRPPILGLALAVLLGGNLLSGIFQPLIYVTPWILGKGASLVASRAVIPAGMLIGPLIATSLWSLVFLLLALLKFERTEF
jgi:hypothetical protein